MRSLKWTCSISSIRVDQAFRGVYMYLSLNFEIFRRWLFIYCTYECFASHSIRVLLQTFTRPHLHRRVLASTQVPVGLTVCLCPITHTCMSRVRFKIAQYTSDITSTYTCALDRVIRFIQRFTKSYIALDMVLRSSSWLSS